MEYLLGASLTAIESPLSSRTIDLLGSSAIQTFEPFPADFGPGKGSGLLDSFAGMLARTGKSAPTFHLPWGVPLDISSVDEDVRRGAVAGLRDYFPMARALGSRILIEHPSYEPIADEERPMRIAQARKSLRELEPILADHGFRMGVELLPRTCLGHTGEELVDLVGDCGETIGVCLDVNHLTGFPEALPGTVRLLGKRLIALHLSDYQGGDECHAMPGDGVIDWRAFLAALREVGYDGDFNYETTITAPPAEQIAAIESNFNTLMKSMIRGVA